MADTPQRYSDKRLQDPFTVEVLLSEPLQFRPSEILAAAAEDYPMLDWSVDFEADLPIDTAGVSLSALFGGKKGLFKVLSFTSQPGPLQRDWADDFKKSELFYPGARDAVARHKSALHISLGSLDDSLAARFDAARRITCLAAVFARLPVTTGIYFHNANLIVPPKEWTEAADQAVKAKIPWPQWIHIGVNHMPGGGSPPPITVSTVGMAAFNGHELALPYARVAPSEGVQYMVGALVLLLEYGNQFCDGDMLGAEGDANRLRIRFLKEGMQKAQTDTWMLFHPKSTVTEKDELELFGERPRKPSPPGIDNSHSGDPDALKKKLYGFFAAKKD